MPKPVDWDKIKVRWEAGEDLTNLAIRTGRSEKAITEQAKTCEWDGKRRPTLIARTQAKGEKQPRKSASVVLRASVPTLSDRVTVEVDPADLVATLDAATANARHLADFETLRRLSMGAVHQAVDGEDARMLTAITNALKAAQDGQRKCLGMDKRQETDEPEAQGGVVYLPAKGAIGDGNS